MCKYERQGFKGPVHFMTRSYDLISCRWSDPNFILVSDLVVSLIGIRLALFPSYSVKLIPDESTFRKERK